MRTDVSGNSNVPPPSGITDQTVAGQAAAGITDAPVRASAAHPRASASLQPQAQRSSLALSFRIVQEGDALPAEHATMTIGMRGPQDDFQKKVALATEIRHICEIKLLEVAVDAGTKELAFLEAEVAALRLKCARQQACTANAVSQ